ncbi:hypothetical protein AB4254_08780 [Vibrio breoganii]
MQIKWIIGALALGGAIYFGASTYMKHTQNLAKISDYQTTLNSFGIQTHYDSAKITSFKNGVYTLNNVSIQSSSGLKLTANKAIITADNIQTGKLSLNDVSYSINELNGTIQTLAFNNITFNPSNPTIEFGFVGLYHNSKASNIANINGGFNLKQSGSRTEVNFVISDTNYGEARLQILASTSALMEPPSERTLSEFKLALKGAEFLKGVSSEFPLGKDLLRQLSSNLMEHHYPKSQRTGKSLNDFLHQPISLELSLKGNDEHPVQLRDLLELPISDPVALFDLYELELTAKH